MRKGEKANEKDILYVTEVFSKVQGEGIYTGMPMTFIRLSGCNVHCSKCDTQYSWKRGRSTSSDDLISEVKYPDVCITGGEPLLQDITLLVTKLKDSSHNIHVETNGTIVPSTNIFDKCKVITVSPKLPSMGIKEIDEESLEKFIAYGTDVFPPNIQLKFVIDPFSQDTKIVLDLLTKYRSILGGVPIILQPLSEEKETLTENITKLELLIDFALSLKTTLRSLDIRALPQLHRLIWGRKRGV